MQHRRQQAKSQRSGSAPMLVLRGIRNKDVELRERMAVQAFAMGYATTEHFQTLADMHSVMLLAGSTDDSRKWAWDYCQEVTGPTLQKIAERYTKTKRLHATTSEKKALGEFVSRYRDFWLRQPSALYVASCNALQEHYNELNKHEPTSHTDSANHTATA